MRHASFGWGPRPARGRTANSTRSCGIADPKMYPKWSGLLGMAGAGPPDGLAHDAVGDDGHLGMFALAE